MLSKWNHVLYDLYFLYFLYSWCLSFSPLQSITENAIMQLKPELGL